MESSSTIVVDGAARTLDRAALGSALRAVRAQTLRFFDAGEAALGPGLRVPCTPELNLPLWELGHVGWFADWWIARLAQHPQGLQADPIAPRTPARLSRHGVDADALYNSSTVAHDRRWRLALPDADATRQDLAESLNDTLALLAQACDDDQGLYFFRLALLHECMHAEAAVYMAQTLGIDPYAAGAEAPPVPGAASSLCSVQVPDQDWTLGWRGPGFAFDNELGPHTVRLKAFEIDAQPVSWARWMPFVEAGGYQQPGWWSDAGRVWLQQQRATAPRHLRETASGWERQRFGRWQPLDPNSPACHLTGFEAEAWCRWAARRLPTEAEWEAAALTQPSFAWGTVWEWTASPFAPFPGFVAHPYRDYSAPWFDTRPVLKGASAHMLALMRHAKYRNYFTRKRNDVMTGFRSVAV